MVSAAEHLVARSPIPAPIDLEALTVVVPGSRAARTLLALLVERCAKMGKTLVPPTILTPGAFAETLARSDTPAAPCSVRRLAWARALRSLPDTQRRTLVPRPPEDDLAAWCALASMFERAHEELTREGLTFEAVAEQRDAYHAGDAGRWAAAAKLEHAYAELLDRASFADASLNLASGDVSHQTNDVVLVGAPELGRAIRRALDPERTIALIFAPESLADRFDDFGCVATEQWASTEIEIGDEQIVFATTPDDQCEAAFGAIARLGAAYAPDEIVVGAPDAGVLARLEHRARLIGAFGLRAGAGRPMSAAPPITLLRAASRFLATRSYDAFATLVRHPDAEAFVGSPDLPAELDRYAHDHLPTDADHEWRTARPATRRTLDTARRGINDMLADLQTEPAERPVTTWTGAIAGLLAHVYDELDADKDRDTIAACEAIGAVLDELRSCPDPKEQVAADEALAFVADLASTGAIPPEPDTDAIEALGWLELALDPAPAAIITGMNEGVVPSSPGVDPLLPESARAELGLPRDETRLARDAYWLSALLASKRHVTLIAGSRGPDGDPLAPSRLLLRTSGDPLAHRIARLVGDAPSPIPRVRVVPRVRPGGGFPVAPIRTTPPPIESISVTQFRTYLASPYAFYLERVLSLRENVDAGRELDNAGFGTLIHGALQQFGESDERDSTDPDEIDRVLDDSLTRIIRAKYGKRPPPAVSLQQRAARARLADFAHWQAERRNAGWQILHTEWSPESGGVEFDVDDNPITLRGKIDRIDSNGDTLAIIDYKTGESVKAPDKTHRRRDEWIDLQLPLYRLLAESIGASDSSVLAYVKVPKRVRGVDLLAAEWSREELESADEAARGVVRRIREADLFDLGDWPFREGAFAALGGVGLLGDDA